MATVTTQELVDRARAIADIRDNFVTNSEWMYWANQERKALEYLLARSGWTQNTTTQPITITGAGHYDLSTPPLAVLGVWESSSQGYRRLTHNNAVEFKRQAAGSTLNTGPALEYSFTITHTEDSIVDKYYIDFYPEPTNTANSYLIMKINQPAKLVLPETGVAGEVPRVVYPMGWEEYIVLGMARRALIKEESDSREAERLQNQVAADIERAVWGFSVGEAPTIRNVDKVTRGWSRELDIPPVSGWRWF